MTMQRRGQSALSKAQQLKSVDWLQSALVHGALLLGLVISVQWKSKAPDATPVQVEIFSPPAASLPPPVANKPISVPVAPQVKPTPTPVLPTEKVDISIEKKKLDEKKAEEKKAEDRKVKAKLEEQEKLEAKKELDLKKAKAQEKPKTEKKAEKQAEKQTTEKTQDQAEEKSREEALRKIIASAGSSSGNTSDKNAEKSGTAGNALSASDISRLQNMIRSNTVFQIPESMKGNPEAEFVVNLLPDCTVVGVKLKKSSGLTTWDDAAERAISRIKQFPRPASGTCASSYAVTHKPIS
jgi:colicin import membrane protein